MKNTIFILCVLFAFAKAKSQDNFSEILAAGVDAANLYAKDYATPAAESLTFNIASGWYDDARVLKPGKFKIQLRAQATFTPDEKKTFLLDPTEYERIIQESYNNTNGPAANINVSFGDGSTTPRLIATALGENEMPQQLVVESREANTGALLQRDEIDLAQGLSSEGLEFVPTAFLQAGVGLGAGLELKARFVPKVKTDEFETGFYGGALQWEFTKLFDREDGNGVINGAPITISALVGYSRLDASYDFEDGAIVDGRDQSIETQVDVFNVSLITGTNWDVFNLYGGINYISGSTETRLLGDYTFTSNTVIFPVSTTVSDPVTVESDTTGLLGTVGAKLTLGAFNLHADYTFGEFNTATASIFVRL
ncbi:hypothetical protein JCM19294_1778 [Nonlabens tegetincola]|uniref:Uncharacterized protein n=1 Tax=Nonlabens tegetincola TaxID=323273 RepID=A0A090PZQ9_9FLAO|nr:MULTISPECIES: DUF6588 family protein [Nonlabens]ALM21534.1 hypothetical protein AAT17_09975 [Nonlabens sp. MIC269]ARN71743.1 hypothetical protein BST91_08840 [Nonlabens tegetincola]GAK96265.1 hypothetical protein JCM19294_1778 [Nonlabens tegetincola]